MPLVQCPECQKEVSSAALSCPQCAFPYPGKKERENGKGSEHLRNCEDCGSILSKQAKACPHCGAPSTQGQQETQKIASANLAPAVTLATAQETWLCPHCGVPFTRRVKDDKGKQGNGRPQPLVSTPAVSQSDEPSANAARIAEARQDLVDAYRQKKEIRKSPLWGESHSPREEEPQYPRPKRKWSLFVLVIVSVLIVGLASFAYWQLQDLNPLEALVYWQM